MAKKEQGFKLSEIQKIFPQASARKVISNLLDKGYIDVQQQLKDRYIPKYENVVFLENGFETNEELQELLSSLDKAPKQQNIVLQFLHLTDAQDIVFQKELLSLSKSSSTSLKTLVQKGIFRIEKMRTDRVHFSKKEFPVDIDLSEQQQRALTEINTHFKNHKTVLLKGVTGSGKTHIYFRLIEKALEEGQQVLYLLPEIALTAQIIKRLQAKFGEQIGIYHSRFGNQERVEIWQKTLSGECKIILGARSSLLLPFQNLGLIVIDEEHDTSFKQTDPAPRYNARDTALVLAHKIGANVIMGSATPSVNSYFNASQKKFALVELQERFGSGKMPKVEIIDLKKAYEDKQMSGLFSRKLLDEMQKSLQDRKQIILFQNRRGYSPFIICQSCGFVPHCDHCDVSLTYHKLTDKLHCHYCGTIYPYVVVCPTCNSNQVTTKSFGTEKIEEAIQYKFPNARVARFDWDALKQKNKFKELITAFEHRQIDILVGTQMVVKGLDFEHVNLVGVLSADSLLAYPDYRVNERVFQLLEQVSGRAGRKDDKGKVLIQTHRADHPIIKLVQEHDYEKFYSLEHLHRKDFVYPPYCKLIRITVKHKDKSQTAQAALTLLTTLTKMDNIHLIGPAEPPVSRIRNQYLQEILIKLPKRAKAIKQVKENIYAAVNELTSKKNHSTLRVVLDVDP
jgi:primosomal protein N' (replication factor Y)